MLLKSVTGGTWLIETTYGAKYEVEIDEVSDHKGLSFSGYFKYDGVLRGVGCFPFNEIAKMKRIEG